MKKMIFKYMNSLINSMNLSMLMILMFSTFMVMTSTTWLNSWIFLEINMMTFIPLMMNKSYMNKSTNSMIKYFIVQSFSSSLLFLSFILLSFIMMNEYYKMNMKIEYLMKMIISMALLIKLGVAPFHWWMPHIMIKLNWKMCFLLMTWQKIAPLILILQINNKNILMNMCAMLSMITGAIMGMNQSSIKLLLTYSSINHMGWIILNSMMNQFMMILYLIIYMLLNLIICFMLNKMNIIYMNQLFKNINKNYFNNFFLMTMMLSLGGMPPFLGFMPKMFTFTLTMKNFMFLESLIMILTTLITLKFYMNMMMPTMNIFSTIIKFSKSNSFINNLNYSLIINLTISFIILTLLKFLP